MRRHTSSRREIQALDLFDGVENRGVVAAVIKSADLRQAPPAHALRQIHGNLTAEAWTLRIARNASRAQMRRDHALDARQGHRPDGERSIRSVGDPCVGTAVARSTNRPVPWSSILAGHSGHIARIKFSQPSSFSRNLLGRAYSMLAAG